MAYKGQRVLNAGEARRVFLKKSLGTKNPKEKVEGQASRAGRADTCWYRRWVPPQQSLSIDVSSARANMAVREAESRKAFGKIGQFCAHFST
jgi:hypothetical protein